MTAIEREVVGSEPIVPVPPSSPGDGSRPREDAPAPASLLEVPERRVVVPAVPAVTFPVPSRVEGGVAESPGPDLSRVLAPVAVVAAPATPAAVSLEEARASYAANVRARLQARKTYPSAARALGWEGRVAVRFVVGPSGSVSRVEVQKGSGFEVLDRAAVDLVHRSAPYPAPPGGEIAVSVPVHYSLVRRGNL